MFPVRLDQIFGRHFDAEIDDVEAVVRENDLDEVLADVVHVAFDGGEQDFALRRVGFLLHELFEVRDGGLHRFGGLQHFGDDQLVGVEQAADFLHAVHERAVDDVERGRAFLALEVEVGDESFLRAFENVIGEPAVERQVGRLLLHAALGGAEMLVDRRDVVLVDRGALFLRLLTIIVRRIEAGRRMIPQQILDKLFLFGGNGGVALQFLGVDDGEIETGLRRVIEEDGVDDFPGRRRQTEADVAHAEDRLALRQLLFDEPDAFNCLDRAADVILVAGRAREHERIEDQVFFGMPCATQ